MTTHNANTMTHAIIWKVKTSTPAQFRTVPREFMVSKKGDTPVLEKNQVEILPDIFFKPFNKVRSKWDSLKRTKYIPLREGALVPPRFAEKAQRSGLELVLEWDSAKKSLLDKVDDAAAERKQTLLEWGGQQDWTPQKFKRWERFVNKVVPSRHQFMRQWVAESTLKMVTQAESDDPTMIEAYRQGLLDIYQSGALKVLEDCAKWANERSAYAEKSVKSKKPMNAKSVNAIGEFLEYLEDNSWISPAVAELHARLSKRLTPLINQDKVYGRTAEKIVDTLEPISDFWDLENRYFDNDALYPLDPVQQEALSPSEAPAAVQPTPPETKDYYLGQCFKLVDEPDQKEDPEESAAPSDTDDQPESDDDALDGLDPSLRDLFGDDDSEVS